MSPAQSEGPQYTALSPCGPAGRLSAEPEELGSEGLPASTTPKAGLGLLLRDPLVPEQGHQGGAPFLMRRSHSGASPPVRLGYLG